VFNGETITRFANDKNLIRVKNFILDLKENEDSKYRKHTLFKNNLDYVKDPYEYQYYSQQNKMYIYNFNDVYFLFVNGDKGNNYLYMIYIHSINKTEIRREFVHRPITDSQMRDLNGEMFDKVLENIKKTRKRRSSGTRSSGRSSGSSGRSSSTRSSGSSGTRSSGRSSGMTIASEKTNDSFRGFF
jgi:uncharacterized membrane protein YgcG